MAGNCTKLQNGVYCIDKMMDFEKRHTNKKSRAMFCEYSGKIETILISTVQLYRTESN
jgi:hypothetical protein